MPRSLTAALLVTVVLCGRAGSAGDELDRGAIKEAVTQGLALVRKAAANYPSHRACFSCHHQTLPMLAVTAASGLGINDDGGLLQEQAEFTLESFRDKRAAMREGKGIGGGAMTVGYALWALELAGRERDETTDAMVAFLLATQRPDGHWGTGRRPPLEESSVTVTVLAASGLGQLRQ